MDAFMPTCLVAQDRRSTLSRPRRCNSVRIRIEEAPYRVKRRTAAPARRPARPLGLPAVFRPRAGKHHCPRLWGLPAGFNPAACFHHPARLARASAPVRILNGIARRWTSRPPACRGVRCTPGAVSTAGILRPPSASSCFTLPVALRSIVQACRRVTPSHAVRRPAQPRPPLAPPMHITPPTCGKLRHARPSALLPSPRGRGVGGEVFRSS